PGDTLSCPVTPGAAAGDTRGCVCLAGSRAPPVPGFSCTRIIYDRKFLMECRNSPVAKTPPSDLPDIPGVTSPSVEELKLENHHVQSCEEKVSAAGEEEQFDMDI
uniref:Eukaryotic translation initiation factor 4E binding protein 1 n=1 Tax=Cyanistes caeruleus TaxID=156563 RepID=A0A8C0UH49_CYACU